MSRIFSAPTPKPKITWTACVACRFGASARRRPWTTVTSFSGSAARSSTWCSLRAGARDSAGTTPWSTNHRRHVGLPQRQRAGNLRVRAGQPPARATLPHPRISAHHHGTTRPLARNAEAGEVALNFCSRTPPNGKQCADGPMFAPARMAHYRIERAFPVGVSSPPSARVELGGACRCCKRHWRANCGQALCNCVRGRVGENITRCRCSAQGFGFQPET